MLFALSSYEQSEKSKSKSEDKSNTSAKKPTDSDSNSKDSDRLLLRLAALVSGLILALLLKRGSSRYITTYLGIACLSCFAYFFNPDLFTVMSIGVVATILAVVCIAIVRSGFIQKSTVFAASLGKPSFNKIDETNSLVDLLDLNFDMDDLEDLASNLEIDWGNLRGQVKRAKARSLVQHCANRSQISELKISVRLARPKLNI